MKKEFRIIMFTIVIIISSLGVNAYAANVYIPDSNFKAFLVANYDTNSDGEIQETEAQAVIGTMDTPGHWSTPGNIADLSGIEAFINIIGLNCSYEQLTSLDVKEEIYGQQLAMDIFIFGNMIAL